MSLRFIFGRIGSGKSHECLKDMKDAVDRGEKNNLILIVPEQFSFEAEKKVLRFIGEKGVFKVQVLSFKRLCYKVFNSVGGATHKRLNDCGKSILIYDILRNLKKELTVFQRASTKQGFTDVILEIITEFKRYNITPEILKETSNNLIEKELKDKLNDLYKIYNLFEGELHKSYIDGEDELSMAYEKLDECAIFHNAEIWIDEFSTFTPQQYNIIKKLMKKSKRVNIALCCPGENYSQDDSGEDVFSVVKATEDKIIRIAMENNVALDKDINLDSIDLRNRDELDHIEKNFFKYPYSKYKKEPMNLRVFKALNNYEEVEFVSKDIVSLVRDKGYRFNEIAVICRELDSYEKIVSVVFNDYNIPYFLDSRRKITDNPFIILVLSIFDIKNKNWSYESVFRYLKTGLLDIPKEDIDKLENFVLAYGIKGKKWNEFWKYGLNSKKNQEEYIKDVINPINEIREIVLAPLKILHDKLSSQSTVRELCTYIYEFLVEIKAMEKMELWIREFRDSGDNEKADEYEKVIQVIFNVFDQLVEIMGDSKIKLDSFIEFLNIGLSCEDIGIIPFALDQVIVGDLARIKSHDIKAVYIIGVNDGIFPRASREEGILSDDDRNMLKNLGVTLASDMKTKAFEENFLIYNAITMATDYMVITYPLANIEGGALRPSVLISRFKKIFPKLIEESALLKEKDEEALERVVTPESTFNELIAVMRTYYDKNENVGDIWAEVYTWFEQRDKWNEKVNRVLKGLTYSNLVSSVKTEKIRALYQKPYAFDVSRIEKYAQCPFAYFVQYGLKARDRKIYEFGNPDFGSFVHGVLDSFSKKVKTDKLSWREIDDKWSQEAINGIVEKLIEEDSILKSSSKYNYMTSKIKKVLNKSVSVISEHFKRSTFEVLDSEVIFGEGKHKPIKLNLPNGEEILLRGRIDRVDVLEYEGNLYVRVVDYKSGNKKFSLDEVYNGLQLQLLIYLDAILSNEELLMKKNTIPGAILYFRIDDPIVSTSGKISEEELKNEILKNLKMNGLLLNDTEILVQMDNEINQYSVIIPAYVGKSGVSESLSSVATKEQFDLLREYVRKTVVDLCDNMLKGNISIHPIKNDGAACCDYCNFNAVCQFDTTIKDNCYKSVNKKQKEDLWKLIEKKVKTIGDGGES